MTPSALTRKPLPYVSGETRRFKAEPSKLGPLAARVMGASGSFSTKRMAAAEGRGRGAPIMWGALLFVVAGAFAVAGSHTPTSEPTRLQAKLIDAGERMPALGMEDYAAPKELAEAPPAQAMDHDRQDQFEIARFLRHLAPASGNAPQKQARPSSVPRLAER